MSESSPDPTWLPLTKFLHRSDMDALLQEVQEVEQIPMPNGHEWRAWEYAMALRALSTWRELRGLPEAWTTALDVGGGGSELGKLLGERGMNVRVVDPVVNWTLGEYLEGGGEPAAAVFCISVLEHVPVSAYTSFLVELARAVRPGGLLFLTSDARDLPMKGSYEPDQCHFHWMRARIYDTQTWRGLARSFSLLGLELLGEASWEWRGPQVYDYSFCSMALVKEKGR